MRVLKYSDYNKTETFVNYFVSSLNVSDSYDYPENNILKEIFSKFNINPGIENEFKHILEPSLEIIKRLIENSTLNVDTNEYNINLLSIAVIMVYYLEAFKSEFIQDVKPYNNSDELRDDIKNLLEELKLSGIGNGIVKKIVECFNTISSIIKELLSNVDESVECIFCVDGKKVTSILNAILSMIDKYNFNVDNFNNLYTELNSMGVSYLINKLNDKLGLGKDVVDVEEPTDKLEIIKEEN